MNRQNLLSTCREILIADAGVEDLNTLLDGLDAGVATWLVQPGEDAVGQIIKAITTPGLKTLHLLAHGAPGQINLGGRAITAADFRSRFDGAAERDLDIAFWSCNTGAGDAGQSFVQAVAEATGARVAAADGLVGNAEKGGSWGLGVRAPFSVDAQRAFAGVLAVASGSGAQLAAGLQTDGTTAWLAGDDLTVTDTATVAQLALIVAGSNTTGAPTSLVTTVTDSATAIAGSSDVVLGAFAGISTVTANTAATVTEAGTISGFAKAVVYAVTGTATALAGAAGAALNEATDITATTAATVVEAGTIETAGNSGTNTYAITDTAAALAAAGQAVLTLGSTVTASDAATVTEAGTISGFAKAVVYAVTGTATALAGAAGAALNEATDITATTAATLAEGATIEAATNSGANTYALTGIAADYANAAGVMTANGTTCVTAGRNATITDTATLAQLATVDAANTTGTLTYAGLTGVAANFASTTGTMTANGTSYVTSNHAVTVSDAATVAQLTTIDTATTGTLTYSAITDTAANLATLSGSTWTVNAKVLNGTNVTVSGTIDAAELAAIDAANVGGTVTLASTLLSAPNTYLVETASTPSWTVANNMVANVIDAAGAQLIHIASGGKLNLSGSDGHNVIVFDAYAAGDLTVSHSGTTVIFTAGSTQVASIATDVTYAASQTIEYSNGAQVELTLIGTTLALDGTTISTVGSIA